MHRLRESHKNAQRPRTTDQLTGLASTACLAFAVIACSSSKTPAGSAANIQLLDENNYSSTSKLTLSSIDTKAAADLNICWDNLVTDLQCHTVAPQADIGTISLVRFVKMHDETQVILISGNLDLKKVDRYLEFHTDNQSTCTNLSTLGDINTPGSINLSTDFAEGSQYSYVLIAANGTTPGVGARSMVFLNPLSSSDVTSVSMPAGCNELAFTANLSQLTKVVVPRQGPWTVDWSKLSKDSTGQDMLLATYDNLDLMVGFYQNLTVDAIASDFFNVETNAKKLWQAKILPAETNSEKLAYLTDSDNNPFPGFDQTDGVWAMAIRCPDCQNPAPLFFTILDVNGGDQ